MASGESGYSARSRSASDNLLQWHPANLHEQLPWDPVTESIRLTKQVQHARPETTGRDHNITDSISPAKIATSLPCVQWVARS